jgi:hypothetical protein
MNTTFVGRSPLVEHVSNATGAFICELTETKKDTQWDLLYSELHLLCGRQDILMITIYAMCEDL